MEVCDIFLLYHSMLWAFHHEPYYYAHPKMNNLLFFLSLLTEQGFFFQAFDHSHHPLLKPLLSL